MPPAMRRKLRIHDEDHNRRQDFSQPLDFLVAWHRGIVLSLLINLSNVLHVIRQKLAFLWSGLDLYTLVGFPFFIPWYSQAMLLN